MKPPNQSFLPKARKADLVTRWIPQELLVYDLKRHKAFCLNDTAAKIWRHCNGKKTVAELTAELENDLQSSVDEQIVWLALKQLEASHLLERQSGANFSPQLSRRTLVRAGLATAIALPIVTMIAAPTAQAQGTGVTQAVCITLAPTACPGGPCTDVKGKNCVLSPKSNTCKCK